MLLFPRSILKAPNSSPPVPVIEVPAYFSIKLRADWLGLFKMKALLLLIPTQPHRLAESPPFSTMPSPSPLFQRSRRPGGTCRPQGNLGWQQPHRERVDVRQEHRFHRGCHQPTRDPGTPAEGLYAVDTLNKYKSFSSARSPLCSFAPGSIRLLPMLPRNWYF